MKLFGRRAIPFIVERASCRVPCKNDTYYLLGALLRRMGPERGEAGPALIRIGSDRSVSPRTAHGVFLMIAELGKDGRALEPDLLRERENAPYLSPWIDQALVGIGSSRAGGIFAERLAGQYDVVTLRDLSEVGQAGHDSGPAVVRILEHDPELRAAAVTTLGYIGYTEATPALIAALDDPVDVRVAWAAARSLGRLKAQAALEALDRAASEHWYGPVREAARHAAAQIRTGEVGEKPRADSHFPFELFEFEQISADLPACKSHREKVVEGSASSKLHARTSASKLKRLHYPSVILSYGASDEEAQQASGADVIEVTPDNIMEHREAIDQIPDVALRVEKGWLAGSSRGEWGGELVFVGDDGRVQRIVDDNVEDIYRLGSRFVATTGLAHLTSNSGAILELSPDSTGRWKATTWRVLPGAPTASWLIAPNGLMVDIAGGGAVVIYADGDMRMAECAS